MVSEECLRGDCFMKRVYLVGWLGVSGFCGCLGWELGVGMDGVLEVRWG